MKPKHSTSSKLGKPFQILHPVAKVVRKKKCQQQQLKKRVRFNLNVKVSSSENKLYVQPLKMCTEDLTLGCNFYSEGKSQSSTELSARPSTSNSLFRSISCCPLNQNLQFELKVSNLRKLNGGIGLGDCCFSFHFPKVQPRKGILKYYKQDDMIAKKEYNERRLMEEYNEANGLSLVPSSVEETEVPVCKMWGHPGIVVSSHRMSAMRQGSCEDLAKWIRALEISPTQLNLQALLQQNPALELSQHSQPVQMEEMYPLDASVIANNCNNNSIWYPSQQTTHTIQAQSISNQVDHNNKNQADHNSNNQADHNSNNQADHNSNNQADHNSNNQADHNSNNQADHNSNNQADHNSNNQADHNSNNQADHNSNNQADHNSNNQADHNSNNQADHNSNNQADHNSNNQADHNSNNQADHNSNNQADHNSNNQADHNSNNQADHNSNNQADHNSNNQADHNSNNQADHNSNNQADHNSNNQADYNSNNQADHNSNNQADHNSNNQADHNSNNQADHNSNNQADHNSNNQADHNSNNQADHNSNNQADQNVTSKYLQNASKESCAAKSEERRSCIFINNAVGHQVSLSPDQCEKSSANQAVVSRVTPSKSSACVSQLDCAIPLTSHESSCSQVVRPAVTQMASVLLPCPVLNCGKVFSHQALLDDHLTSLQHSPCSPLATLVNAAVTSRGGYLCPSCGQLFLDEKACLEHMLQLGHSALLSPVHYSVFTCPQCLCFFSSLSHALQHMDNLAHHSPAFVFKESREQFNSAAPIPVPSRLMLELLARCQQVPFVMSCQNCACGIETAEQLNSHLADKHLVVSKCSRLVRDVFSELLTDQACAECHQYIYQGVPASGLSIHLDCPLQGPVLTLPARSLKTFILHCGITGITTACETSHSMFRTTGSSCSATNIQHTSGAATALFSSYIPASSKSSCPLPSASIKVEGGPHSSLSKLVQSHGNSSSRQVKPPEGPMLSNPEGPMLSNPEGPMLSNPEGPMLSNPEGPMLSNPEGPMLSNPEGPMLSNPEGPMLSNPEGPMLSNPEGPMLSNPEGPMLSNPEGPMLSNPEGPMLSNPEGPRSIVKARYQCCIFDGDSDSSLDSDFSENVSFKAHVKSSKRPGLYRAGQKVPHTNQVTKRKRGSTNTGSGPVLSKRAKLEIVPVSKVIKTRLTKADPETVTSRYMLADPKAMESRYMLADPKAMESRYMLADPKAMESRYMLADPKAMEATYMLANLTAMESMYMLADSKAMESMFMLADPKAMESMYMLADPKAMESRYMLADPKAMESRYMLADPKAMESRYMLADPKAMESRYMLADPKAMESRYMLADPKAMESRYMLADPKAMESRYMLADPTAMESRYMLADPTAMESRYMLADPTAMEFGLNSDKTLSNTSDESCLPKAERASTKSLLISVASLPKSACTGQRKMSLRRKLIEKKTSRYSKVYETRYKCSRCVTPAVWRPHRQQTHSPHLASSLIGRLQRQPPLLITPSLNLHLTRPLKRNERTTVKRYTHYKLISPEVKYLAQMRCIIFADLENVMVFNHLIGPLQPATYIWGFICARPKTPFHLESYYHKFPVYNELKEANCVHISTEIGTSKDAADIAMTLTMGKLDDRLPTHIPFFIVSEDRGFREVVNQLKQRVVRVVSHRRGILPIRDFRV
ncbi:uncharacterized protein LOC131937922 [Physella acuta]|uniref:uncharacterized protein LOC131937922 n=1 Tax=Physella acuta TaxID=109671 RepID=UPI0027DBA35F|nr:uncharacterized protein LOC131937922 [Physella acuta]